MRAAGMPCAWRGGVSSMEMEMGAGVGEININAEVGGEYGFVVPLICAMADPNGKWWKRLRGNPKRLGEVSQAAFLLKAEMMGFSLAVPWGDSEKYDFVVWGRNGGVQRVEVKGTGRLHRRGYEVQPVRSTRRGGKK